MIVVETPDTLTTITDAAREVGIGLSSVYYHVLNGDIERHRYGPVTLVDIEQVRAVMSDSYKPRNKRKLEECPV